MITTLTGVNSFLLKAELTKLIDVFLQDHGEMGLEKLDGADDSFERMTEALQSLPFLASKKLVVLRTPGGNKQFAEKFDELLPSIPNRTNVIIVEPKLDKRLSYYKTLKKLTDFKEFHELDVPQLAQWLVKTAKEKGGEFSWSDAQFLVERVGANQQLLYNELTKLLDYNPKVTRESIELLTDPSPQSTVFELLDAAFNGRTKRALALYEEQRRQKVEPLAIMALLAWQLHILALIKTAGERAPGQIVSEAKLNPYVVNKSQALASNLTLVELKKLISEALRLDIRLKSESIDADEALQDYLIHLSI